MLAEKHILSDWFFHFGKKNSPHILSKVPKLFNSINGPEACPFSNSFIITADCLHRWCLLNILNKTSMQGHFIHLIALTFRSALRIDNKSPSTQRSLNSPEMYFYASVYTFHLGLYNMDWIYIYLSFVWCMCNVGSCLGTSFSGWWEWKLLSKFDQSVESMKMEPNANNVLQQVLQTIWT